MKNTLLLIFAFLLSEFYNVAVSQDFAFYNINIHIPYQYP